MQETAQMRLALILLLFTLLHGGVSAVLPQETGVSSESPDWASYSACGPIALALGAAILDQPNCSFEAIAKRVGKPNELGEHSFLQLEEAARQSGLFCVPAANATYTDLQLIRRPAILHTRGFRGSSKPHFALALSDGADVFLFDAPFSAIPYSELELQKVWNGHSLFLVKTETEAEQIVTQFENSRTLQRWRWAYLFTAVLASVLVSFCCIRFVAMSTLLRRKAMGLIAFALVLSGIIWKVGVVLANSMGQSRALVEACWIWVNFRKAPMKQPFSFGTSETKSSSYRKFARVAHAPPANYVDRYLLVKCDR
jgi:hypothetical protein